MTITNDKLWQDAPEKDRISARCVMIGASVQWHMLFVPPECDGFDIKHAAGGYLLTMLGPHPHPLVVVVAHN
jgi:hypothetical protein